MEFTIAHQTAYVYPDPVRESYTLVCLQPRNDSLQFCTNFDLRVDPRASSRAWTDRFGNVTQHFAILPPHRRLRVEARSHVVTLPRPDVGELALATRALLDHTVAEEILYDFLHESRYVSFGSEVRDFVTDLEPAQHAIGAWCAHVSRAIHRRFTYDTRATEVRSTAIDALRARGGVCQDYAHVMIAVLRSVGVPARYVSGYIFGGEGARLVLGAEASHAWCEAYLPPYGWVGFDPTNDRLVDDQFVRVAIGRDYRDVSPVRGVYRGSGQSEMSVNVAMENLPTAQ